MARGVTGKVGSTKAPACIVDHKRYPSGAPSPFLRFSSENLSAKTTKVIVEKKQVSNYYDKRFGGYGPWCAWRKLHYRHFT